MVPERDAADSLRPRAFWPVIVVADGEYIIELRRYPRELNAAISADIPPGDPVYDQQSHRSKNGIGFPAIKAQLWVGDEKQSVAVSKDAAAAEFRMKLKKGSRRISARFIAADGRSLDSFYVYARKSK